MRTVTLSLAAALLAAPAVAGEPLRVFFTVATPPAAAQGEVKSKADALKRDRDAAWSEYEAFDKQLKKENGKNHEKWPPEVKAVTFVETGRPTLLRLGMFGDIDVPTRGTAWIEETTGRVLQTELEVGRGRSAPTMVTKFGVDDRLQVTVPVQMRTRNPDGIATYTNFRRFAVSTDINIPLPPSSVARGALPVQWFPRQTRHARRRTRAKLLPGGGCQCRCRCPRRH